jgi:hypothetical protein
MWKNSRDKLHIDAEELWFPGVYGQPVPKPLDIKKWEKGNCYLLLDKTDPAFEGRPDATGPMLHRPQARTKLCATTPYPKAQQQRGEP